MSTSLARQLKGLKATQRDVLKTASKAKVSFLFDSREAYKIDEEVIYTLCMKGIEELCSEYPNLKNQFEHYKEDVFDETAKNFYRGSQTKEVLETLDAKLKNIITMISPYFMNASSYKVLEFLIRIYEVQAYHKVHVFFSFLPFYDTPQFLRLLQCMELKSDPMLSFFEPFASKGVKLRLDAMIRFMSRENGAYLKVFSDIAFKFLTLKDEQTMFINQNDNQEAGILTSNFSTLHLDGDLEEFVPHYRFWGTLVFKIISSEEASRSESFLYVLIPYIAKALDSKVKELQIGALSIILGSLDVSLLAKKIPFSEQYMNAFLTEICKSASNSLTEDSDGEYFNLCVKTCLRILHAQQIIDKLNERLSMFSFNANSSKYQIEQTRDAGVVKTGDTSYKWISDILNKQDQLLAFFGDNNSFDLTPLLYKCLEFYSRSDKDSSESSKRMIKILATQKPSHEVYKMTMAYMFAIVAGHLPECQSENATKFAVLVLDYLESRDSFIYVQVLDQLLQGKNEKHRILDKIEEIEMEQLGKTKKKVVTIDTGVSAQKDSMPVLLALYHRKKTVKKAALLSLYQQWIENEDVTDGKDLRMIVSMLIQFIEQRETEDVLIVTFTLLEYLLKKQLLAEALINQLYTCLIEEFVPKHFPPDRQYSNDAYMKGVNLYLSLKSEQFEDTQALVYTICNLNEACKALLDETTFAKNLSKEGELIADNIPLDKGLELLNLLVRKPELSCLENGKIWSVFETYFNSILKKSENDPTICCLSLLSSLKEANLTESIENMKNIVSLFIGKLPSLSNSDRAAKERLKVNDILTQSLNVHPALIPIIFETIIIKHLNCDVTMMVDFFTVLYHENKENASVRLHALLFLKRSIDRLSDLDTRTQLLANYLPTFLSALSDPEAHCRRLAMDICKIYENYESFSKVLKKEKKKQVSVFEFVINKRKVHAIKKGALLDSLEEFIEELTTTHEAEVTSDPKFIENLIKVDKNEALFEYLMYAISSSRTPLELQSYLRILKSQVFKVDQMDQFCNVLVSIEFKATLLGKELAFQYMPSLIDILCSQDTTQDAIAYSVHDCLLGVLDQYNAKSFDLAENYVLKANRKLVSITVELAKRNATSGATFDKIFNQLGLVTDIIQNCMKNPEAPAFYLKMLTIDLLKSVQEEYIAALFKKISSLLTVKLCYDFENFTRVCFILNCCQSVELDISNLSHLLSLIHQLGGIISEIGISEESTIKVDPIELLITLINITNSLKGLDTAKHQEMEEYISKLVDLFKTLLDDLTHVYTAHAKITEVENMMDPVEEFLAKDSLFTSAQKEKQEKGIEEDDEEVKVQKDIILYQGLTNLLLLLSNLQDTVELKQSSAVGKIYSSLAGSLKTLHSLYDDEAYSPQAVATSVRQLLNLQNSAFQRIAVRSLDKIEEGRTAEHNVFLNTNLEIYLSDVIEYSENLDEKLKFITQAIDKIPEFVHSKFYSLTIVILLKFIGEDAKIKLNPNDLTAKVYEIENEEFRIAQNLLFRTMKNDQAVKTLTHMIMMVNYMATFAKDKFEDLHQKSEEFSNKKSKLLFASEYIDQITEDSAWMESTISSQKALSKLKYLFLVLLEDILPKQHHAEKYGEDRHPLVQYFHKCVHSLSETAIKEVTELILAFDFGTTLIEHQLHLINDTKKQSTGKGVQKVLKDKKEKKEMQKLCKSVERLVDSYRKFNQEFVATLVPLKIHVPVVTSILGYSDELILLKTRSVNTLGEVVLRGAHNVASGADATEEGGKTEASYLLSSNATYIDNHRIDFKLQELFKSLIVMCSQVLEKYCNDHKKKAVHTYLQSILILMQKILNYKNQKEIEALILPSVYVIAKTEVNTMLSCSAIMFVTSAFDIYKADIYTLEQDLVNDIVIKQGLSNIKKVLPGGSEETEYFANSVITSILDSYCILMKSIFNQLLTPEQLTEILSVFFSIPEEKGLGDSPINHQIDVISSLIAKNVNPQIALHALFNIFDYIAVKPAEFNSTEEKLKIYCSRYFNCISKIFRNLKKDFIEEYNEGISKFLQKAFLIPQTWEKSTQTPLRDVSQIHDAVLGSFKTFILKLNEVQLKPIFLRLVKWASKPIDSKATKPIKDLDRLYVFFKVVNCLLETLMSIFTPYLSYYINLLTELLSESFEENHSKALIMFMQDFNDPENSRLNIIMVVNTLLECIRLNYYFDTESTIPVEYFERVSDSILHVMDFYILKGAMNKDQYLEWVKNVYQKVIVDVLSSMDNTEVTRNFLDDLLRKSKHDVPAVRLASLKVTEALVYKLEERFLAILSDVLPYVSEALEDTNDDVEETARNIVQKIETMTGESIQQYLK